MKNKNKFASLIEVRKLIALLVTITFIVLSAMGKIEADKFMLIFVSIISYYFGKSTALDIPNGGNHNV